MAEFVGKPAAMVVGMGFATNSLVLPAIVGAGDLIISDEQNHKSIVEGARMSGAKIRSVRHNDHHHLEELLQVRGELAEEEANPAGPAPGQRILDTESAYFLAI